MLAVALAVTTGLLAPLAAAPALAVSPPGPPQETASLSLDLVLGDDSGSSAIGESIALSAIATDGAPVLAGHDTDPGPGSTLLTVIAPGSFALEQRAVGPGEAGLAIGAWTCAGGALADGIVTVAVGVDAVCTIGVDVLPTGLDPVPVEPVPVDPPLTDPPLTDPPPADPLPTDPPPADPPLTDPPPDDPDPTPAPPARLTLAARVVTDDGGAAVARDWVLRADGPIALDGSAGGSLIDVPVAPGDYVLSATGPAGYRELGWSCTAGALVGSTLSLEAGDSATCTVGHDDHPVDLALTLDDGDARAANGGVFGLTAAVRNVGARDVDRHEPVTATVQLPRGTSLVDAPAGCAADRRFVACSIDSAVLTVGGGVDLAFTVRFNARTPAGVHSTIAVVGTKDDPAPAAPVCPSPANSADCEGTELRFPTITLLQALSTDDGGDATLAEFSLTASGPVRIVGAAGSPAVTVAPVPAGTYRLGVTAPRGYETARWTCVGAAVEGDAVTIVGVVDVTCTIGHDDQPVDLQLAVDGSGTAPAGGEARFSIVVTNAGGRDVDADEAVTVRLVLPTGLTHLDGPAECAASGGTVSCAVDPSSLRSGAAVLLELVVAVAPDVKAGTHESRASVTTDDDPAPAGGCEVPSNNVRCVQTRIVVGAVAAEKSAWEQVSGAWVSSDGVVGFGDLVQFRILVRATGDAPSTRVGIVDRLPNGLLVDGMPECSVPCTVELDAAAGMHRVEIGTMEPGAVVTITFTARVPGVPSQADGTTVRVAFDAAASLSSDNVDNAPTNIVTMRASHALPAAGRSGGEIPIGGISMALALLVAGGLLLVRSREQTAR